MENSLIKRVVLVVAAIAVVAGAAVAVIALLGGVTPRETRTVAGPAGGSTWTRCRTCRSRACSASKSRS